MSASLVSRNLALSLIALRKERTLEMCMALIMLSLYSLRLFFAADLLKCAHSLSVCGSRRSRASLGISPLQHQSRCSAVAGVPLSQYGHMVLSPRPGFVVYRSQRRQMARALALS